MKSGELLLHGMFSVIGGYLGVYAILARCDLFGSAQTANLIYLVGALLGRSLGDFLLRLGALLLYMGAMVLSVWLPRRFDVDLRRLALLVDAAAIVLLGFLPEEMNPILGLYPIFFAMSFQWCSSKGARGYVSSTIFSTNNLKQFTTALAEFALEKDRAQLDKAKFFGFTLLCFHLGVLASYLLWLGLGVRSVWLGLVPVAAALLIRYPRRPPRPAGRAGPPPRY